jgi:hypothetical protein
MASQTGSTIKRLFAGRAIQRDIERWSDDRVQFKNGSVIWFLPASEGSVRGWHNQVADAKGRVGKLIAVCDEAEILSDKIYTALLGTLTSSDDNRLMVLCSGGDSTHWTRDVYKQATEDPDMLAIRISTEDLVKESYVSAKRLKQLKKQYPHPSLYKKEIQGHFVDDAAAFLPREAIERALTDDTLPLPHDYQSTYVLGADLSSSMSQSSDRTGLVLIQKQRRRPIDRDPKHMTGRQRVSQYLVDSGQARPRDVGLTPDSVQERPIYRVAGIWHFQYLSSVDLEDVVLEIKQQYPTLREVFAEKYEGEVWDHIARRIKRPDDPLDRGRFGRPARGDIDICVNIVPPTNDRQQEAFGILSRMITEGGELRIPRNGPGAPSLIEELLNFGISHSSVRRLLTFGAQKGHDDLVYALGWALYGARRTREYIGTGGW